MLVTLACRIEMRLALPAYADQQLGGIPTCVVLIEFRQNAMLDAIFAVLY